MNRDKNIFKTLDFLSQQIKSLESELADLKNHFTTKEKIYKNHLLRFASNENLDVNSIYFNLPYLDFSPQDAFHIYNKESYNYILLDVSSANFTYSQKIKESLRIELEFLEMKANELPSKSTPIYVISEKGIRSIIACETLYKLGFVNINNISGGHKFWPGHQDILLAS